MKKILIILFLIIFSILPSYSKDRLDLTAFEQFSASESNVYQQYLDDIKYIIEINLDKEKMKEIAEESYHGKKVLFLVTIKSDGTIKKIERIEDIFGSNIFKVKDSKFHEFLYEPIEKYGFNPFYYGMNVDEVRVMISCRINEYWPVENKKNFRVLVSYSDLTHGGVSRVLKETGEMFFLTSYMIGKAVIRPDLFVGAIIITLIMGLSSL